MTMLERVPAGTGEKPCRLAEAAAQMLVSRCRDMSPRLQPAVYEFAQQTMQYLIDLRTFQSRIAQEQEQIPLFPPRVILETHVDNELDRVARSLLTNIAHNRPKQFIIRADDTAAIERTVTTFSIVAPRLGGIPIGAEILRTMTMPSGEVEYTAEDPGRPD